MAANPPWRIPQQVIIPLSILMIIFATFSFTGYHSPFREGGQAKLFTTSRTPTEEHFLNLRKRASHWSYHPLHVVPAIIWSLAMPLQHHDRFRLRFPLLHRLAGYLILLLSLLLSLTGYLFFFTSNAYTHPNLFHLHALPGLPSPLLRWPTFELTLWLIAPFYWLTIYKTAAAARARDFPRHRRWAVLHTICASFISVERVSLVVLLGAGFATSFLPREAVHGFFGVGRGVEEMAEAEMAVFALANTMTHVVILSWLAYECARAGYFDAAKGYLSSRAEDRRVLDKKVE
ncbi:hypothetical protein ISF_06450 [Cordyceps fumosorosea ARSEF 2679]|uniref:Uncharacterized protein n=1 Tax=Cordyceps fumosorosea (strain ARSEF 2679) TaxID=1081104 RepID=A0A167RJX3_CORFA|nr:hypothetical protein ISF_06450 [Cordyceps fumosorosea ARSEF 2679]OAA58667.1 hypothetical protein ISF_06450 [Cordyceps fumosorosea ARSEF 2679]